MTDPVRLYSCQRCNAQVTICRDCDHGHRYCMECAPIAGQEARKRAAARYQSSRQGKLNHAARQSRYRERKKKIVTHKGSIMLRLSDSLAIGQYKIKLPPHPVARKCPSLIYCHYCQKSFSTFLRHDFLRSTARLSSTQKPLLS
jgi:hypothetical protein